jgi:hypothetical protein
MAMVLACIEDEDVDARDRAYYEKIRPSFVQRRHQLQLTTCARVWESLAEGTIEVLLMFVHSKQSCCWQVSRRVHDAWQLPYPPPLIYMIVEQRLEEIDDPGLDRQLYLTDPFYAESYDIAAKAYFDEWEYMRLYNHIFRTFKRVGRNIVGHIEGTLFRKRFFDRQKFQDQLAALFGPEEGWSWTFCRVSYHPIMEIRIHIPSPERVLPVVCSWEGKLWAVDTWDKFLEFMEDEGLRLADEMDREDILAVFSLFQPRNIVREIHRYRGLPVSQSDAWPQHMRIVRPPTYSLVGGEHQVRFWAIGQPGKDLEEWLFRQEGTEFRTQFWIRENNFGFNPKADYSCYSSPFGGP